MKIDVELRFTTGSSQKPRLITETKGVAVYKPKDTLIKESVGFVENKPASAITKELGEAHPFDPKFTEGIYKKVPIIFGAVNKYVDYIVGPGIYVSSEDERAQEIINMWIRDNQFSSILRQWVKEALIKPGGYLELGGAQKAKKGEKKRMKVLDGCCMYVLRDEKGNIKAYNQYMGAMSGAVDKNKIVAFKPDEIAALHFNVIGSDAYGMGIVYPVCTSVNNLIGAEKHMHMLMERKANAPLHIKVGTVSSDGQVFDADPGTVSAFGQELESLTNRTEWVTGPQVDMSVVDFGQIGEKFQFIIEHDLKMLVYGLQIPEVILGGGNIPEGLAKEQGDAHEKIIRSLQEEIEKVLEQQVFARILEVNGLSGTRVEVEWGEPSTQAQNEKMAYLTTLLSNPQLQPALRNMIEKDIARMLGYNAELLLEPEEKREEQLPQPRVPGANNPRANNSITVQSTPPQPIASIAPLPTSPTGGVDPYNEDVRIEEWLGFNYKQYLDYVLDAVSKDNFELLRALDSVEIQAGKLTDPKIELLREVLRDGFKNGNTIKEIAQAIKEEVGVDDLYEIKDGVVTDKVLVAKEYRPVLIARTESTRLAAEGARKNYAANGIAQYKVIASVGSRTCSTCEGMNNRVFSVDETPPLPLHSNCRCTIVPVTRLD